jgi:hypothetical protein
MIQALGYSGPIDLQMSLGTMREVPWLYAARGYGNGIFTQKGSEIDDDAEFSIPTNSEALRQKPDDIVTELPRYVFFSVNWPTLIDAQQKVEELIQTGYKYNGWR